MLAAHFFSGFRSNATRSSRPPEGEQEEQWLADAGLSNLISEDSQDVDDAVLLSTLTRTQAEAVQRRVESYTLSLRKRNKPAPRDVRDVFDPPINQVREPNAFSRKCDFYMSVPVKPFKQCVIKRFSQEPLSGESLLPVSAGPLQGETQARRVKYPFPWRRRGLSLALTAVPPVLCRLVRR